MAFRRRDYGAWGETLPGGFDNVPGGMPYGFVGALGVRTDSDTGLIWMRQRWYDPTLQRFISRDPIGLEGGANLYGYVASQPMNLIDPMGLQPPIWGPVFVPDSSGGSVDFVHRLIQGVDAATEGASLMRKWMQSNSESAKERGMPDIWLENPKDTVKNRDHISPQGGKVRKPPFPGASGPGLAPGSLSPGEWKEGVHSGKRRPIPVFYDKFKHCVVACYATLRTKDRCAIDSIGKAHEIRQIATFTSYDNEDVRANRVGIDFGSEETTESFNDCIRKCSTKYSPVYFWPYYPPG